MIIARISSIVIPIILEQTFGRYSELRHIAGDVPADHLPAFSVTSGVNHVRDYRNQAKLLSCDGDDVEYDAHEYGVVHDVVDAV